MQSKCGRFGENFIERQMGKRFERNEQGEGFTPVSTFLWKEGRRKGRRKDYESYP